jgi:non-specific serine/threonine protein kinase
VRLPFTATRFFGRERERTHVASLLQDASVRLVTLTGLGGSGKTRLAVEVARQMAPCFPGGVYFVALADLLDARLVPGAIVGALGGNRGGNGGDNADGAPLLAEQVAAALPAGMPALLVLDNFEQLTDEGALLVRDLLAGVPALTC